MNQKNKGDILGAVIALLLGILNMLATEAGAVRLGIGLVLGSMSCFVLMICSMRLDLIYFDEGSVLHWLNQLVQDKTKKETMMNENRKEFILSKEVKQSDMDHLLKSA